MATLTTSNKRLEIGPSAAVLNGGDLLVRERERPVVPTGFRSLDTLLPAGGIRPGSLVEWLVEGETCPGAGGAASLAFAVACRLAVANGAANEPSRPQTILVVDRTGWFHPPAVLPWLKGEQKLIVARPSRDDDEIWTIDQALRCTGVAAVLAWPRMRGGRGTSWLGAAAPWSTAMRRWQLAAAGSGATGLFVRPLSSRNEPSWAEARVVVSPRSGGTLSERRLQVSLAGGNWAAIAAAGRQPSEVVLDLARGCAGLLRPSVEVPSHASQGSAVASQGAARARDGRGGVACRAS